MIYLICYSPCLVVVAAEYDFFPPTEREILSASILYTSFDFSHYVSFISHLFTLCTCWFCPREHFKRFLELKGWFTLCLLKKPPYSSSHSPAYSLKVLVFCRQSWQHAGRRLLYNRPDAVSMLASRGEKQQEVLTCPESA